MEPIDFTPDPKLTETIRGGIDAHLQKANAKDVAVTPTRLTEDAASFITAAHAAFKRLAAYGGACVYGVNVEAMRAKAEALTAAMGDGRHE